MSSHAIGWWREYETWKAARPFSPRLPERMTADRIAAVIVVYGLLVAVAAFLYLTGGT